MRRLFLSCLMLCLAVFLFGCRQTEEAATKPITVQAVQVQVKDLPEILELSGTVNPEPNQSVKIAAVVPGLLTEVAPKAGDWVTQGMVVARLQQSIQTAQVQQASAGYASANANLKKAQTGSRVQEIEQARAAVDVAKANLLNAQKNRERLNRLFEDKIAAGKDVDYAVSQEQAAAAQVHAAQATLSLVLKGPRREDRLAAAAQDAQAAAVLSQARANLNFTRITSPIAGIVAERYLNVGDQAGPANPILFIVNPNTVLVQAGLPVGYNQRVIAGQPVEIQVADQGAKRSGRVLSVGIKVDPLTNTLPIQIEVANPRNSLKIGMTVQSRIVLAEHRSALVIPQTCLIGSSDAPDRFTVNRLVADGNLSVSQPTLVVPGIKTGGWVEIKQGLKPGQWVISNVGYELPEKTRVTVRK